jgi:uncharacterized protein with von Willebrand factor type A (vWA) domain
MEPELVLSGLFLHLRRQGLPLGPRDFLDSLGALRRGFGLHDRAQLLWLCQTLWARSEEELRHIALLFAAFPQPTPDEVETTRKNLLGPERRRVAESEPAVAGKAEPTAPPGLGPKTMVHFAAAGQPGLPLPRPRFESGYSEHFVLSPRPLIALRSLIVAWRRFRVPMRTGARTELDIPATIADQSRSGRSVAPVLIAPRRNLARLTVLTDTSPSMLPWRGFAELLQQSLEQSQLHQAGSYFFSNLPEDTLYRTPDLTRPLPFAEAEERHRGTPLLIFGDGGAARGYRNRERMADTRALLARWSQIWRPIVWMNPMPRGRWRGTSFEQAVATPSVACMPLGEAELIRAVDVMRGRRQG